MTLEGGVCSAVYGGCTQISISHTTLHTLSFISHRLLSLLLFSAVCRVPSEWKGWRTWAWDMDVHWIRMRRLIWAVARFSLIRSRSRFAKRRSNALGILQLFSPHANRIRKKRFAMHENFLQLISQLKFIVQEIILNMKSSLRSWPFFRLG